MKEFKQEVKLKVGQEVVIIDGSGSVYANGETVQFVSFDAEDNTYSFSRKGESLEQWFYAEDFKIVNE